MSPSDKAQIQKMLAELFAQPEQQVPEGNPIAEYYGNRASADRGMAAAQGVSGAISGLAGAYELLDNPFYGIPLMFGSSGLQLGAVANNASADKNDAAAKMWKKNFPAPYSGPARRGK